MTLATLKKIGTMGKNSKLDLDKLKNDVHVLKKLDMTHIVGGKRKLKWNAPIKGKVPQ